MTLQVQPVEKRARRILETSGRIAGTALLFALTVAVGVVLHLGTPAARRLACGTVNGLLAQSFEGSIVVERVGGLGLGGARDVHLTIRDPRGVPVVHVDGADVAVSVLTAARSAVFGKSNLVIAVTRARIRHVDLALERSEDGTLTLQRTFEPRTPSPKPPDPKARGLELTVRDISVDHVWAHGRMGAGAPPLDVDLYGIAGSFYDDPKAMILDATHVELRARGLPSRVDPYGTLAGQLRMPSRTPGEAMDASVSFDGWVAEQKTTLAGSIDGKSVAAHLDVPHVDPETLKEAVTAAPLRDPGSIHVEASGTLSQVALQAHMAVGAGIFDLRASANIGDATVADATVTATGIDAYSFGLANHSRLGATVTARVTTAGGLAKGDFELNSPVGQFAQQLVPPSHVRGHFTEDSVAGAAKIEETGAPTEVDFNLHPLHGPGSTNVLDLDVRAEAQDLARVPRLGPFAHGHVQARAKGRFVPSESRISAQLQAAIGGVQTAKGGLRVDAGDLDVSVTGVVSAPSLDARIQARGLQVSNYAFKSLDGSVTGGTEAAHVLVTLRGDDAPDIHLDAQVQMGAETLVDHAALVLHRKDVEMVAHVASVRLGGRTTSLEGLRIDGIGKLPVEGNVKVGEGLLAVEAKSEDLDLGKLGRLLKMESDLQEGHVAFDIDVTATRSDAKGHVTVDLFGGKFPYANGASGRLEARFDGRILSTELRGAVGDLGWASLVADDVRLGGGLMDPASWRAATGHVMLDTNVDLRRASSALPRDRLPFEKAEGRVHLRANVGRAHEHEVPDISASVSTQGFVFVAKRPSVTRPDGSDVLTTPPFQTHGVDVELAANVNGATGKTQVAARLFDRKGPVVQLNAEGTPPYGRLLAKEGEAAAELENLPLKVQVVVPKRSFADLPEFARLDALRGSVEAAVSVEGTALAPRLDAKLRGYALEAVGSPEKPVNVDIHATYDTSKVVLTAKAARPEGFIAEANAEAEVRFADLVKGTGDAALAWNAHAAAAFHGFPVGVVPFLAQKHIHGALTGTLRVDGLHEDAKMDVDLGVADLHVGHASYRGAKITAHAESGKATTRVRIDQDDGFAEAQANAGFAWGRELLPSVDPAKPLEASLKAHAFRAAIARPFLAGTVNGLDGRIDADTKLAYDLSKKNGKVLGALSVRDGTFEMPNAGGAFHAVRARVSMDPFGTVHVTDLSADGATGRLAASATVMLDGLTLRSAEAKVHINKGQKLPLEVEGVPMGYAWGDVAIKVQASANGSSIAANIDLPTFNVDLPQSIGHSVQGLDPNPDVRVGVHQRDERFAVVNLVKPEQPRPPGSSHLHLTVNFGKDVWVRRDTTLKLQLHGGPTIDVTDQTKISGQITAGAGTIEVQSKKFEIEHAAVSFVGKDPANPQIVATAYWDAPSKTRVFVDVTGTPKDLKIAFRSEPDQLSQDAILSLILFGDENGSPGAAQSRASADDEDVNAAAGVGGGIVTQGLNKAIAGVTSADITTRVDTSESQNPRPELALQITKEVSAAIAYNLGIPPPGQNPDHTQLILDYRFIRNWLLQTTLGDSGSSIVDVLWQFRY